MKTRLLYPALVLALMSASSSHAQHSTTDRVSDESTAVAALALSVWDVDGPLSVTGLRLDLHAQYMHELPVGNVGGFVMLPLSYAILGADDMPGMNISIDNELDMGNLELGAAFARGGLMAALPLRVVGRVGIAIGTADDEDTEPAGFDGFGNQSTVFARITDTALTVPDSTWLRMSIAALGEIHGIEFRTDLGVDVPLADDETTNVDPIGRLNLAAVYHFGPAGLGAEVSTVMGLGDTPDGADRYFHTAAVVATSRVIRGITPTLGLIFPLDEAIRDLGHDFSIALGVQGTLPQP